MVVPPPGSKSHKIPDIPVTNTAANLTPRQFAAAVIADKLGIKPEDVSDDTELGSMAHEITTVLCFKTGNMFVSNAGMKAKDVFKQLRAS